MLKRLGSAGNLGAKKKDGGGLLSEITVVPENVSLSARLTFYLIGPGARGVAEMISKAELNAEITDMMESVREEEQEEEIRDTTLFSSVLPGEEIGGSSPSRSCHDLVLEPEDGSIVDECAAVGLPVDDCSMLQSKSLPVIGIPSDPPSPLSPRQCGNVEPFSPRESGSLHGKFNPSRSFSSSSGSLQQPGSFHKLSSPFSPRSSLLGSPSGHLPSSLNVPDDEEGGSRKTSKMSLGLHDSEQEARRLSNRSLGSRLIATDGTASVSSNVLKNDLESMFAILDETQMQVARIRLDFVEGFNDQMLPFADADAVLNSCFLFLIDRRLEIDKDVMPVLRQGIAEMRYMYAAVVRKSINSKTPALRAMLVTHKGEAAGDVDLAKGVEPTVKQLEKEVAEFSRGSGLECLRHEVDFTNSESLFMCMQAVAKDVVRLSTQLQSAAPYFVTASPRCGHFCCTVQ